MKKYPKLRKVFLTVGILLIIQTTTFYTIAPPLLKNKLLPEYFATLARSSDTVFVRGFYPPFCTTGDRYTLCSHNLEPDEEKLRSKLEVSFIYFNNKTTYEEMDSAEQPFSRVYATWYSWPIGVGALMGFPAKQTEELYNKSISYRREVTYHWFLFFWVKRFEWFQVYDKTCPDGDS